eukprot:7484667-Lingulodinium_polyedra.AAC.2
MVVQRDSLPVPLELLAPISGSACSSNSRRRRGLARRELYVDSWTREALAALNWLSGREGGF